MKKTLTVNLGGTVFQIDEDAYNLLDNYLNNLRFHFRKEEGGEEIVRDMEMRISELFVEGMEGGQQVITIDNVEAVIERMGRPEQLDDEDSSTYSGGQAAGNTGGADDRASDGQEAHAGGVGQNDGPATQKGTKTEQRRTPIRRLYRDVDNRILGGVLSGIAAYFGWNPTALRIAYVLLGLLPSGPSMLIIYFILQFVIPAARTATEKLQMRGEPVNMENIGKTVTGGFERDNKSEAPKRTGLQRFLDAVVSIIGLLVKVFLGFIIVCCIPFLLIGIFVLFTLLMSAFGVFVHIPAFCMHLMPSIPWDTIISAYPVTGVFFFISLILIFGIPVIVIAQIIMQHYRQSKSMSLWAKLTLILLWFVALVAGFILFFNISIL